MRDDDAVEYKINPNAVQGTFVTHVLPTRPN